MTVLAVPVPVSSIRRMSIDEFMALPDAVGYELVDGVLTERKLMGALSDHVASRINRALGNFCEEHNAGHVFGSETTYRCFDNPDTGRRADVSFIRRGRLTDERIPESYITIPADLAVEVVSPNDLAYEVEEKVALYLGHGFGEVWVVYPNTRAVHVHRKGESIGALGPGQALGGRGPLEGFTCAVAHFFPPSQPASRATPATPTPVR
ncbi:MAG: Uma2 family endonuclease [Tepidisphaeraceae bacterium]